MTKKILAMVLVFALVITTAFCLNITSSAIYDGDIPVIYIVGQGSPLGIPQSNGSYKKLKYSIDTKLITSKLLENKDVILKGFLTQDWTEFDKIAVEIMTELLADIVLNEDGEPTDGSKAMFDPTVEKCKSKYLGANNYKLETFAFYYDWRLDPKENMDELRAYIDMVLEATGKENFALCGRCEGACLILEYLDMFPDDKRLTDVIMYASAAQGASPIGECYAGEMYVDPDAVERFVYDKDFGLNADLKIFTLTDETLREIITIASNIYGLDLACFAVNEVYEQIYLDVVPQAMINSYASFPGYWAMVEDKYYEKGKQNVFGGQEEKYAKLIEKIDDYHYNIFVKSEEILNNAIDNGVDVFNVVKYGKAGLPVTKDFDKQSDMYCTVENASWGATSTIESKPFDKKYIKAAEENGTIKYISPDKCIDASTAMLKDRTWFIKNLLHKDFPNCVDDLTFALINGENVTIDTYKEYPQYLFYDEETQTISPLNIETQKSNLDIYGSDVAFSIPRKIKPVFTLVFWVNKLLIKIFTPRAKTGLN